MADVEWIKITTDMFDNRKIKYLRTLPEGNNIVLIWVMLLTMAGRCNSGGMIFLTENIPYTTKILADELGFDENIVKVAIAALEKLNMVTTNSGCLLIPGWEEYQNVDGMEKIKEQNRIRKQRQRNRLKEIDNMSRDCHVTCHAPGGFSAFAAAFWPCSVPGSCPSPQCSGIPPSWRWRALRPPAQSCSAAPVPPAPDLPCSPQKPARPPAFSGCRGCPR